MADEMTDDLADEMTDCAEKVVRLIFGMRSSNGDLPVKLLFPVASVNSAPSFNAAHGPLRGKRLKVGLLDNSKPNAGVIVKSVYENLRTLGIADDHLVSVAKPSASVPVSAEGYARLAECDLVLNALGN